jgi:hypothetical protein
MAVYSDGKKTGVYYSFASKPNGTIVLLIKYMGTHSPDVTAICDNGVGKILIYGKGTAPIVGTFEEVISVSLTGATFTLTTRDHPRWNSNLVVQ